MDLYFVIKTIHILSSTVLFGTGLGTAFFMLMSKFSGDIQAKLFAAKTTVIADYIFTTPAIIIQPLTGFWLIYQSGVAMDELWLLWTYALYVLAGACWIPVVFIQIRLKKMIQASVDTGSELPPSYHRLFKIWFLLGWPAFMALVAIFYLMVTKPS